MILVKGDNTVAAAPATQVLFKNCAPFTKCTTKIDRITVDDAEDLDLVMTMYNLIEYSSKFSETKRSLWFYSKDEATNFNADIANTNNFQAFKYKAELLGNTDAQPAPNNADGNAKFDLTTNSRQGQIISSLVHINKSELIILLSIRLKLHKLSFYFKIYRRKKISIWTKNSLKKFFYFFS